ncbi:MAG: hypothetical protein AAFY28_12890 [Actinomycetota bacterium]
MGSVPNQLGVMMDQSLVVRLGRLRPVLWTMLVAAAAVAATLVVSDVWQAGAAPGDTDATFNPTAGCRLTDTRGPNNIGPRATPLGAGEVFEVMVHGSNGDCSGPLAIPADATGVALNVTAVGATAASNIRVYPANLTDVPLLSNLNVTAGAPPTPNKVDVQLSPDGKLNVFNFRGSVHILIDVVGYYTPSSLQTLADQAGTPGPQGPAGPPGAPGPAGPPGSGSEPGVVELSHGFGPTLNHALSPLEELNIFTAGVQLIAPTSSDAIAVMDLNGPVSMTGQDYALTSLRYCVDFISDGPAVNKVDIKANTGGLTVDSITVEETVNNTDGCTTIEVNDTVARRGIHVSFFVDGRMNFLGVDSTWSPVP